MNILAWCAAKASLRGGTAYTANMKQIPVEAVVLSCINIPNELTYILNAESNISFLLTTYSTIGDFISFLKRLQCVADEHCLACASVCWMVQVKKICEPVDNSAT